MKKNMLLASAAAAALLVGASSASAQVVNVDLETYQFTLNGPGAPVINFGFIGAGNLSGDASTAAVSASGATSAVSFKTVNANGPVLNVVGVAGQLTGNLNIVVNAGYIGAGNISGNGATAAISASGATSSVSVATIDTFTFFGDVNNVVGLVGQATGNFAPVINFGAIDGGNVSGDGAVATVAASGATSSVSVSSVNTYGFDSDVNTFVGGVFQGTLNFGNVLNVGFMDLNNISGNGALAAISASGATSSVAVTTIDTPFDDANAFIGVVGQNTMNFGNINNFGLVNLNGGNIRGDGASVVVAASGATSSVSATNINTGTGADTFIGSVGQRTFNVGDITNVGFILNGGNLSGAGSTTAISASGATSSVSVSNLAGGDFLDTQNGLALTGIGTVDQTTFNAGTVVNVGFIGVGNLSGNGATAVVSASGATSSVSVSNVSTWSGIPVVVPDATANVTLIGSVDQNTRNVAPVLNLGAISAGNLSGNGSIAAVSASGATSSVSVSNVADNATPSATIIGSVTQTTVNTAPVANIGSISAGNLSGHGSTAAVSASGATSVVSISNVSGL